MKRKILLLFLLGFSLPLFGQTHFLRVYTGNPYLAMNIYVSSATLDGTTLEAGDEIGIFDGEVCVGAMALSTAPTEQNPAAMVASTDDPTTTEVDGFIAGHTISFRLWDASAGMEGSNVDAAYAAGDGTFSSQGTAVVTLTAVSNNQPVISDIADQVIREDSSAVVSPTFSDQDDDPLTLQAWADVPEVTVEVMMSAEDTLVTCTPDPDWNGEAIITVAVSDGYLADSTSFTLTVTPVSDAPVLVHPIGDVTLMEDESEVIAADLDTVFTDPDDDILNYTVVSDTSAVTGTVVTDHMLMITVNPDWNGESELVVTADDGVETTVTDTLVVTVTPVNDAPVRVHTVPDIVLPEDPGEVEVADLDTIFTDIDDPVLTFTAEVSDAHFGVDVNAENICVLTVSPNWYGTGTLYLSAADAEFTVHDTVEITVNSVNDNPSVPIIIFPVDGGELDTLGVLVWTLSSDEDFGDMVSYQIQIDDNADFSSPEIAQMIGSLTLTLRPYSGGEGSTMADSAYVIPLNELSGFDNLTDDIYYHWRVQSLDNTGGESSWSAGDHTFFFNKMNTVPNPPVSGFNPQDSVTVSALYPSFSWNAALDPDVSDPGESLSYVLQVSDTWDFSNILYEFTTDPGQTSVVREIGPVADNSELLYRVKTVDNEGLESDWSDFWVFFVNTALDPPLQFLLMEPAPGDSMIADTTSQQAEVTFQWHATTDPDLYDMVEYFVAYTTMDTSEITPDLTWDDLMDFTYVWPAGSDTVYTTVLDTGYYSWVVVAMDTDTLWQFGTDTGGGVLQHFTIYRPTVGVKNENSLITNYQLLQNYPNPFNPTTTIRYSVLNADHVTVAVYDLQGHLVKLLADKQQEMGWYSLTWDGTNMTGNQVSAGVYFYSITAGDFHQLKKMVLLK